MNIEAIKNALSQHNSMAEQDALEIVACLAWCFPRHETVSDALLDAFLAIEAHINKTKAVKEPS